MFWLARSQIISDLGAKFASGAGSRRSAAPDSHLAPSVGVQKPQGARPRWRRAAKSQLLRGQAGRGRRGGAGQLQTLSQSPRQAMTGVYTVYLYMCN